MNFKGTAFEGGRRDHLKQEGIKRGIGDKAPKGGLSVKKEKCPKQGGGGGNATEKRNMIIYVFLPPHSPFYIFSHPPPLKETPTPLINIPLLL